MGLRGVLNLPASLLALTSVAVAAGLPYNPTRAYISTLQDDLVYVFQPSPGSDTQFQLSSLALDSQLHASSLPYTPLHSSLPFLDNDRPLAFTPALDNHGNITVQAGNCSLGSNGSTLWRFVPDAKSKAGNGTWTKDTIRVHDLGNNAALAGSNHLASGIAFSGLVNGDAAETQTYFFGGMCPLKNATAGNWTSAADYSNLMLTFTPEGSTSDDTDYQLGLTSGRGPPVAEAGFSITSLPPTYSNSSNGRASQQQNYVLLGGHTQTAFINMSQVALFSLPQQSWTFLSVSQPATAKANLTAQAGTTAVEPRSGHTAILTSDGKSIVMFGGWVGDVNTPATPSLAILRLGAAYGGTGDWSWSVPTPSGKGLPSDSGIYGHGAVMLPGDVMMVVGGYSIPTSASSGKAKRTTALQNTQNLFYNVTSNSWVSSYTLPVGSMSHKSGLSTGLVATRTQKAGLGAGLAIGCLLVIALVLFYFWYMRRLRRLRETRESEIQQASSSPHNSNVNLLERAGVDGRGGEMAAMDYWEDKERTGQGAYPWGPRVGSAGYNKAWEAERTGLFVNIPSPTRGLRKGAGSRGSYQYHAAPRYDENRTSRGSGGIHPIQERDEEEERRSILDGRAHPELSEAERQLKAVEHVFRAKPEPDPFCDPEPNPLGSHPVALATAGGTIRRVPTGAGRRSTHLNIEHPDPVPQMPNWVAELSADGPEGRVSPTKSEERTCSALSERSTRSNLTATTPARTVPTQTALLIANTATNALSFASLPSSPTEERPINIARQASRKSPFSFNSRTRSFTAGSVRSGAVSRADDADSFMTARTSFNQLRSEGEALLGGRPILEDNDHQYVDNAAHVASPIMDVLAALMLDAGPPPP
ncbi:hypothetical protein LTR66_012884, partial [Elasticomyces elasticus]